MHNKTQTHTFGQWLAALSEWLSEREIACHLPELHRGYHAGLEPAEAVRDLPTLAEVE